MINQTSVSQIEKFDPTQPGGCERRWWLEDVHGLKPDQGPGAAAGGAGHALLATYSRTGELPAKRTKMGKHVTGAILKGELPKPGPDLLVETRFDGQEKFSEHTCRCGHPLINHDPPGAVHGACLACACLDAEPVWLPLLKAKTIWIGGVAFDGFIDLTFRRGDVPVVLDHKFKAKELLHTAKLGSDLINTVQMPVYAHAMRRAWPDAGEFDIVHHYVSRSGVESFFRRARVTVEEIDERISKIAETVKRMVAVSDATSQEDVPFNRKSCDHWLGCAMQSVCTAFKENKMALKPEEAALFDALESDPTPPTVDPRQRRLPLVDVSEEDEEAKAKREFDARMAKIAADKAAKAKADADAKAAADAAAAKAQIPDSNVLPPDAPESKPELAAEQPKASKPSKGKAAAGGPATVTVTVDIETFDKIRGFLK